MGRRSRRILLAGLVILLLGAALSAIAVRYGLAAGPVRAALEARLSATFGQPVTVDRLRLSVSPRVALTGRGVRVGAAGEDAPSIRVERVRLTPRFRSIFSDTIEIEEVLLDGFTVSVLRRADGGGWRVPAVSPAPGTRSARGVSIARVRVTNGRIRVFEAAAGGTRESSSIDDIETELVVGDDGLHLEPLRGRIGGTSIEGDARVNDATVTLRFTAPSISDADLQPLLSLAGSGRPRVLRLEQPAAVSVTLAIDRAASRLSGEGTLRAPALAVIPFRLDRLEAPFTMAGTRLTFAPTEFGISGGTHRGTVVLDVGPDPPRWSAESRLEGLDTGALFDAVAGRDAHVDGAGRIEVSMRGRLTEQFIREMSGRARLLVTDGVLHDFPLLATINRTLRLAEAESRDTRFERLSATLAIAGASATTGDLAIDAGHLRVGAAGRIGFDGTLDLRGRATVSAERAAAAVASVHELARARNSAGEIELPLTIAGTLDDPKFAVDLKTAIQKGLKDELLRRLRRIIRTP